MSNQLPSLPDGYVYLNELGSGAQGIIWLISNNNMAGRKEACKILTAMSEKDLNRFEREIQLLSSLNHPNIVTIYYANQKERFFIMEYLSGGNLYQYFRNKKISLNQRIELFLSIVKAMAFAHSKGLIHRDLKPDNIVMSPDGIAKITDFGIARSKELDSKTINVTSGTPSYMAPELWDKKTPDERSDIWSLGVILYEFLTGQCPFRGSIQQICYLVMQSEIKPPHMTTSLPPLGQKLSTICMRALRKDMKKRYQTCNEMIQDIENIVYSEPQTTSTTNSVFSTNLSLVEDDDKETLSTESSSLVFSPQENSSDQLLFVEEEQERKQKEEEKENQLLEQKEKEKESQKEKEVRSLAKQQQMYIVAAIILVLLIGLFFIFKKPSLDSLGKQLQSRSLEEQEAAFSLLKTRGEIAVPYLVYGLNSNQIKIAKDIASYLQKFPDTAPFYLEEIVKNEGSFYSHQARIIATKTLGEMKADVQFTLYELIKASETPEDLRQVSIKSLIQIRPEKFANSYQLLDGFYYHTKELEKQGYVETANGWLILGKVLDSVIEKQNKIETDEKLLQKSINNFIKNLEDKKNMRIDLLLSERGKIVENYKTVFNEFIITFGGLKTNNEKQQQKYFKEIEEKIDSLQNQFVKLSETMIDLNQHSFAIRILKQEVQTSLSVCNWDWPSYAYPVIIKEKIESLQEKEKELSQEKTLFVYSKFKFYKNYFSDDLVDKIKNQVQVAVEKKGIYPHFSELNHKQDDPDMWLLCEYEEKNIGSYFGNKSKDTSIRKIRSLCRLSYWVKGSSRPSWVSIVSSSPYLKLTSKPSKSDIQQKICELARVDFSEELFKWEPKNFSKDVLSTSENENIINEESTLFEQNATDIIYTKEGHKLEGIILKVKPSSVVFMNAKISRGNTSYMEVEISKKRIKDIKRMPDDIREQRLDAIKNGESQSLADRKKINTVRLQIVSWEFGPGSAREYEGKYFTLICNTPEDFTREIAFRIEQIFRGYEQFFPVKRNQSNKIKIYIFNSVQEYQKAIGGAFVNPAFYAPGKNFIAARCDLASYEKDISYANSKNRSVLTLIQKVKSEIEIIRANIDKKKKQIQEQLDKDLARGLIGQNEYNEALRTIRKQISDQNSDINAKEKNLRTLEQQIRTMNYQNQKLISKYIDQMISMMYHEAFHAFLANFLFTEEQIMFTPRWLNEGLAQYFESSFIRGEQLIIGEMQKERVKFLKKYVEKNSAVHIRDLLVAGAEDFIVTTVDNLENSSLHYTQSWSVVYYISTLYDLKKSDIFGEYIKDIWLGKNQVEAFEKMVKKPVDEFEKDWVEFFSKY